jgi:hypothetical protein
MLLLLSTPLLAVVLFTSRQQILEHVSGILLFTGSGLLGRESETGVLAGTLKYLVEHPFSGVGLTYSSDLFFADSGFVEYTLRGTVLLTVCIYVAWYRFARGNIDKTAHFRLIFWSTVLFEVGFTVITYTRFITFIPFVIAYLNALARQDTVRR